MPIKKTDFQPHRSAEEAQACQAYDCIEAGVYRAPKSPAELNDYFWFCLDHIREHNKNWDYFSGKEQDEIEDFFKEAVTGHRPTWERETHIAQKYERLQTAFHGFMGTERPAPDPVPRLPSKVRKALATLEMTAPYNPEQLKVKYRSLVKRHHPDVNKGDKYAEERFKNITAAYDYLLEHIKEELES